MAPASVKWYDQRKAKKNANRLYINDKLAEENLMEFNRNNFETISNETTNNAMESTDRSPMEKEIDSE